MLRPSKPRYRVRISAVVALAALLAFAGWLLVRHYNKNSPAGSHVTAVGLSETGLKTLAGQLNRPVYWQGPESGVTYELTQTPDGRIYVRYLPKGVAVGSSKAYPTVATYPFVGAYAGTAAVAHKSSSATVVVGHGAVAFYNRARPTNIYLAFPSANYQIEVFNPSAAKARSAVTSGSIQTVVVTSSSSSTAGSSTPSRATAVSTSLASLKALATTLGHPLFWAGQIHGLADELTQTPDGRVYIRYLPAGVAVGAPKPYLTIATYPLSGAYATTSAAAKQTDVVKVAVPGGVAFYLKSHPTSVYVAFPKIDEQIEVFDPSASRAKELVTSGQIHAVR